MSERPSADLWVSLWRPWLTAALAPQELWQSINSGWSFGNVTINERNSSAPQTEQAILAEESYGRQIGKLLDAVSELAKTQPDRDENPAYAQIAALEAKVERIKRQAAAQRVEQFRRDLALLGRSAEPGDQAAFRQSLADLRALLQAAE